MTFNINAEIETLAELFAKRDGFVNTSATMEEVNA